MFNIEIFIAGRQKNGKVVLALTGKNSNPDMDLGLLIIDILFSDKKYAHDLTGSRAYNDATVLDILPEYAVFPLISKQIVTYYHHQIFWTVS
jgi:hypothetical protein